MIGREQQMIAHVEGEHTGGTGRGASEGGNRNRRMARSGGGREQIHPFGDRDDSRRAQRQRFERGRFSRRVIANVGARDRAIDGNSNSVLRGLAADI